MTDPIYLQSTTAWIDNRVADCRLPNTFLSMTISQTTNFRLFQTESACRRHLYILCIRWILQIGRKHCGKRKKCSLRAISPFPTVFSKELYYRRVKTRVCLGSVKKHDLRLSLSLPNK